MDDNKLVITVSFLGKPSEELCATILGEFKDIIVPRDNINPSSRQTLGIVLCFDHINYSFTNAPKDLDDNLLKTIVVTVCIQEREDFGNSGKTIFCSSGLFDNTLSFKKYGF